jgi:Rv3651-like, C-terminal domain
VETSLSSRHSAANRHWRSEREGPAVPPDHLAQRTLNGLAQSGVHRALVDIENSKLLRWLDEPAPFFDWRANEADVQSSNPPMRATWHA